MDLSPFVASLPRLATYRGRDMTGSEAAQQIQAISDDLTGVASVRDQQALRELIHESQTARDEETLLALVSEAKTIKSFWEKRTQSVVAMDAVRRWDKHGEG